MAVIRDQLATYEYALTVPLWDELCAARDGDPRVLPVAGALAGYDPEYQGWNDVGDKVALAMCRAPMGEAEGWHKAMSGVRTALVGPLGKILRDGERRDEHGVAASLLADYARDKPSTLVDLLLDADSKSFSILFPAVQKRTKDCLDELRTAAATALPGPAFDDAAKAAAGKPSPSTVEIEPIKDRIASRGAKAAVALLRLGHDDGAWRLLEHSPDPRARSHFVDALSSFGADPRLLVTELVRLGEAMSKPGPIGEKNAHLFDPATSKRRALIMALAGYPKDALAPGDRDALVRRLDRLYREDLDAGVHSAAELLLRRWAYVDRANPSPRGDGRDGRRWYVNPEGQTMVLVDGPVVFNMGSPDTDPEHGKEEAYHRREIPRSFFIASKEITVEEFGRYAKEKRKGYQVEKNRFSSGPRRSGDGARLVRIRGLLQLAERT